MTFRAHRQVGQLVMGALRGLSVRLGSLREGRKSVIFVSEGFTAMLPPQMRRMDASRPSDPLEIAAAAGTQDSSAQQTAESLRQSNMAIDSFEKSTGRRTRSCMCSITE